MKNIGKFSKLRYTARRIIFSLSNQSSPLANQKARKWHNKSGGVEQLVTLYEGTPAQAVRCRRR